MTGRHLHIHSGDCAANVFKASGLGEPCAVWMDVLHIGALHWRWPDALRRAVRAQVLAGGPHTLSTVKKMLRKQDAMLETAPGCASVTLWVDACLYDQLILCFLIDRLYEKVRDLKLVCVASPDFTGYGELAPAQLAALLPRRRRVTRAQFNAARLAWRNVATPERSPERLRAIAPQTAALPHLPAALERMAGELPDAGGLTLTDRRILACLDRAPSSAALFRAVQALEPIPFMGDGTFFDRVEQLTQKNGGRAYQPAHTGGLVSPPSSGAHKHVLM